VSLFLFPIRTRLLAGTVTVPLSLSDLLHVFSLGSGDGFDQSIHPDSADGLLTTILFSSDDDTAPNDGSSIRYFSPVHAIPNTPKKKASHRLLVDVLAIHRGFCDERGPAANSYPTVRARPRFQYDSHLRHVLRRNPDESRPAKLGQSFSSGTKWFCLSTTRTHASLKVTNPHLYPRQETKPTRHYCQHGAKAC
jgi:hypothetical protein